MKDLALFILACVVIQSLIVTVAHAMWCVLFRDWHRELMEREREQVLKAKRQRVEKGHGNAPHS